MSFLFARCRSGTTALIGGCKATPGVMAFSEVLNGTFPHSYQRYLVQRLATQDKERDAFVHQGPLYAFSDYIAYLIDLARAEKPDLTHLLVECKIENLRVFSYQWCHPANDFGQIEFIERACAVSGTAIYLQRRNVLARFCSNKLAHASGVFHSSQGPQLDALRRKGFEPITVDVPRLIATLEHEVGYDLAFFKMLQRRFGDAEMVEYESVFDKATGDFSPGYRDFFARRFGGATLSPPPQRKVAAMQPSDVVRNSDELIAAMRASNVLKSTLSA